VFTIIVLKSAIKVGRNLIKSFMQRGYAVDVCFTCHRYAPLVGGYETQLKLLAENLSRFFNVKVLTFKLTKGSSLDVSQHLEVYRVNPQLVVFRVPFSFAFVKMLRKLNFDVLHAHGAVPFVSDISVLQAKFRRKVAIYTHHFDGNVQDSKGLNLFAGFYNQTVGRFCAGFADAIVATSKSYAETSETIKPYINKVHVIPLSVDSNTFEPQPRTAVESLKKGLRLCDKKIVLFVGRIVPYKGLEYLVEALKHIHEIGEDFHLLVVGEGEGRGITDTSQYLQKIKVLVNQSGLRDKVHFVGKVPLEELPTYYSLADVVALPSTTRGEAFGSVLIEALACGTPVVASNIPGVRDVLKGDDGVGCYAPPKNGDLLAKALVQMAHKKGYVSESCRKLAVENYSVGQAVRKYVNLYERIRSSVCLD